MNTKGISSPMKQMEEPTFKDYEDAQNTDLVKPSPFDNLSKKRNKNHIKWVLANSSTYDEINSFEHRVDPDKRAQMISFPNKDVLPAQHKAVQQMTITVKQDNNLPHLT